MAKRKPSQLSQKALLVSVKISQWVGRKVDNIATEAVEKQFSNDKDTGAFTKKLLPQSDELREISQLAGYARQYFYENTLPWMADGSRIIASKHHFKFAKEFREIKKKFNDAVSKFEKVYPMQVKHAQGRLGKLYQKEEYPHPNEISDKFKLEITFLPLPDVGDFRITLSEDEKKEFIEKIKETEQQAMRDCWQRLFDVLDKAAQKLSKPGAVFRDSLLSNVNELCELLPSLNFADDPKLNKKIKEVKALIGGIDADDLRKDDSKRDEAAKKLREMTDKMSAFMGGKNE